MQISLITTAIEAARFISMYLYLYLYLYPCTHPCTYTSWPAPSSMNPTVSMRDVRVVVTSVRVS